MSSNRNRSRWPPDRQQTITLSDAWADPKLWWPDTPNLYRLRTTVVVNGQPVDVAETRFGFREWRIAGTQFTLNGVVWHMWADLIGEFHSPEEWLAAYKQTDQRTTRLSTAGQAGPRDALAGSGTAGRAGLL